MYLKSVAVENVGPIKQVRIETPFDSKRPLPLVLVGPNGSGKSTLLSLIVNALVGFKQQAYEQAEVEQNKVYRVRSSLFIRHGAPWSYTKLDFEGGLGLEEWVLRYPRKVFEAQVSPLPHEDGWRRIPEEGSSSFDLTPQPTHTLGGRALSKPIQKLFGENVVLFFPSDRFELPDWLNELSLTDDLRFPEAVRFEGHTARRIFSRALLRPTLEWVKAVTLDAHLPNLRSTPVTFGPYSTPHLIETDGPNARIINYVGKVLARILGADGDSVTFQFSHRNLAMVGVGFTRGRRQEHLPNLLGLSAGQAALFCLFSNIIRDFDLTGAQLNDISDVRGIVILDEADLHLHVDLQYRVLPELMRLFPKVQFILTAHSPLFVMGMEQVFGADGFRVLDVATGKFIATEGFSEFGHALAAFSRTRAFDQRVLEQVQQAAKPVVLVEGDFDVPHLQTAWAKLNPGREMPWDVLPCGGLGTSRGGADMLKKLLWACSLHIERPALGLFDHDAEGVERFGGLEADGFVVKSDTTHKQHKSKPVHALLLPVPPSRTAFVGSKPRSCFLALEHYYSDALLRQYNLADEPVASDSAVFGIVSDAKKKQRFTEALPNLNPTDFANFHLLFGRLTQLLGGSLAAVSTTERSNGKAALQPTTMTIAFDLVQSNLTTTLGSDNALVYVNGDDNKQPDVPGAPNGEML